MHQPLTYSVDGDAIRKERMRAGMSRADLADLVKVTERHICHLENGTRRRVRPTSYKRLRDALAVTDDRLELPSPPAEDPPERT